MVDNIKIGKLLPPLAAADKLRSVGQRQNDNQTNLFKKAFNEKKKKKNLNPKNATLSTRTIAARGPKYSQPAVTHKKPLASPRKAIIDIRI